MATQFLNKVYADIAQSQKGYQVKISVHLKKIQEYLFDKNCPKFTAAEIELLLNGKPEQKIQGLYGFCGNKATLGGLKKSSFYALEILHKAMISGKNKEAILKHFSESDEEDFKQIRLATHISEDNSKTAYELCKILKQKRQYLDINQYLYSEEAQEKFKKWFSEQKKSAPKKHVQVQSTKHSNQVPNLQQLEATRKQMTSSKGVNISTKLEELQFLDLEFIASEEEYFIDTFVDPIDIWNLKRCNKEQRQKISFKQYMLYFIETPISRVQRSKIQQKIKFIHSESQNFNPGILMQKYHKDMQENDKLAIAKAIPHHFGKQSDKNLVKYFFNNFVEIQHTVSQIKENFDQNQKIRSQNNIGLSLRTKMKNSMKYLSSRVEPLSQKYQKCQKLRALIIFLQQNSEFAKLPTTILYLKQQDKINQIPLLYSRYEKLIQVYRDRPILRVIIQAIENNMNQTRIKQITNVLNAFDTKQANCLLGLFYNKKQVLRSYIVPKMIYTILEHIDFRGPELQELQKQIKKYQLLNFREIIKFNKKSIAYQIEVEQGDMLEAFLSQNQFKQMGYQTRCEIFEEQLQVQLTAMCQILKQWNTEYNIFFTQKQILIKGMIEWCAQITNEIKKQEDIVVLEESNKQKIQTCIKVVCKMLIMISKYVDQRDFAGQIEKLKEENFGLYCNLLIKQTQQSIGFHSCPVKRDQDKNYYNDLTVTIVQDTLKACKKIMAYPSFSRSVSKFYEQTFYNFVCTCFSIDKSLLGKLPEMLTYFCTISTVTQGTFMTPFYQQLIQFGAMKEKLEKYMKQKSTQMKQILYLYSKIQYSSIVSKNKYKEFSTQILQLLNQHVFLIAQYAVNCYKNLTRFIMETFLYEIASMIKETPKQKSFFEQLAIVKALSTKITSNRIQDKWNEIANKSNLSNQDMQKVKNQIFTQKIKNQVTYKALVISY